MASNMYGIHHYYHGSPTVFVSSENDADTMVCAVAFINFAMERVVTNISFDQSEITPFLVKYYGCTLEPEANEDMAGITYIDIHGAREEKAGPYYEFMDGHIEKYGIEKIDVVEQDIHDYMFDSEFARKCPSMMDLIKNQQLFERKRFFDPRIHTDGYIPNHVDDICKYISEKNRLDNISEYNHIETNKELRARFAAPKHGINVDFIITPEKYIYIEDMEEYGFDLKGVTRNLQYGAPYYVGNLEYCRGDKNWDAIYRDPKESYKTIVVANNAGGDRVFIKDMAPEDAAQEILDLVLGTS